MNPSAADDGSSLAPTKTVGETTGEAGPAGEGAEGKEVNEGTATAVEGPNEEAAAVEDPDEEMEDDEEEEDGDADADGIEAELMEPLAVLKRGKEDVPEELDGEELEVTEPSEEEPEVEKNEGDGVAGTEGFVDESVANSTQRLCHLSMSINF